MNRPQLNNNPFALIQEIPSKWQGLKGSATDGFLSFNNPMYGVRAGFINLINTYLNKGIDTIEKIFPIYAPVGHGANVPEDYINRVVKLTGIPRDQKLTSQDLYSLGKAIVTHEEGNFWVSPKDFDEGFKLAMESKKLNIPIKEAGISLVAIAVIIIIIYLVSKNS